MLYGRYERDNGFITLQTRITNFFKNIKFEIQIKNNIYNNNGNRNSQIRNDTYHTLLCNIINIDKEKRVCDIRTEQ